MYQYSNSLIRQFPSSVTGNAAVGIQATVYVGETNTLASLFESNGVTPKSNPVTTDSKGFYSFSVADGDYRIVFSSSQFATLRISVLDGSAIREEFDDLVASNLAFRNEQQAAYDSFVAAQGFYPVAGSFETGGTITERNQVLQRTTAPAAYFSWGGALPKVVPPSSTVAGTGGEGVTAWTNRNDATLAGALAETNSTVPVGGVEAGDLGRKYSANKFIEDYSESVVGGDWTAAFNAAFSGFSVFGGEIECPGRYSVKSQLLIPANVTIKGHGRNTSALIHDFSGDMVILGEGASLEKIALVGSSGAHTGKAIRCDGTAGKQALRSFKATLFTDNCLYFDVQAGSQFVAEDCVLSRFDGVSGSDNYAIAIQDTGAVFAGAVPRSFDKIQTEGTCSFDFGSCNGVFINNSFLSDVRFSIYSRDVMIGQIRLANQSSLTVRGSNHSISGSNIAPQITIGSGSDNIAIGKNSYNLLPIIDQSGNGRNDITHWSVAYTPTLTSGGTAPVLGNGSLTGSFSRSGNTVRVTIELTVGSITNLGTGDLRFGLPSAAPNWSSAVQECGRALVNIGGTFYSAVVQVPSAEQFVQIIRDTSGPLTYNSPAAFSSGSTIRAVFEYTVG